MQIQTRRTVLLIVGLMVLSNAVAAVAATYHVAQQHPRASDENAGTADAPFKTISRAVIAAVEGGDTVTVDTGVYREHVAPTRGGTGPDALITFMAKPGARVTIKGSQVWRPAWRKTAAVWQAALEPTLFAESRALYEPADEPFNPFIVGNSYSAAVSTTRNVLVRPAKDGAPCQLTRGQIFVDGRPLWQVNRLEDLQQQLDTFFVARDGKSVFVRLLGDLAPQDSFIEITVREQVLPHWHGICRTFASLVSRSSTPPTEHRFLRSVR